MEHQMELGGKRTVAWIIALAAFVLVGGCSSVGGSTQPTVRSTAETAPADLQLTCAAEAASRLGVDSERVLPVSSSLAQDGVYRVDLNLASGSAVCMIDGNGSVLSVNRVG
jgi:uncharacterized protein YceK